jgi:hypothetical protein
MYDLALLLTGAMLMLEGVWMLLPLLDVFVAPAQNTRTHHSMTAAK